MGPDQSSSMPFICVFPSIQIKKQTHMSLSCALRILVLSGTGPTPKVIFMFLNWNFGCGPDDSLPLPLTGARPSGVTCGSLQVPSRQGLSLRQSSGTILCPTKMPISQHSEPFLLFFSYSSILYLFCCLPTLTRWQTS